jgi:acylphosphatase
MKKHLNILVKGRVQGVSFRYYTSKEAKKSDITGFVMNTPEGHVSIEAEGEEQALESFLDWCKTGPPLASVQQLESNESAIMGFETFEVRYFKP